MASAWIPPPLWCTRWELLAEHGYGSQMPPADSDAL